MAFTILGASYTDDVYTFSLESDSLTLKSSVQVGFHPSWITVHPEDKSLVFAGLEQEQGKIVAIKYDVHGKGRVVAQSSSAGKDPCSIVVVKNELLIANYSNGAVSVLPVSKDAPYLLADAPSTVITMIGSGPNKERQEASHAHQVFYVEETDEVLAPDLGGDRVYRLKKSQDNDWAITSHIDYESGSGPRHVAIHDGYLYTLLELKSSLATHSFPAPPNQPKLTHQASTLANPPPFPHDMLAAEILIPKLNATYPTPYVYISNRNDPSPEGDSVAIFSLATPDAPQLIAEVRTGLKHLRGMQFGGSDDRYLVAGGVNGGGVKVFERTEGGKNLKLVAEDKTIKSPTGFLWV